MTSLLLTFQTRSPTPPLMYLYTFVSELELKRCIPVAFGLVIFAWIGFKNHLLFYTLIFWQGQVKFMKRKEKYNIFWLLSVFPPAYRGLHIYNVWYQNGNTAQFTFMNILERYSSKCLFYISFPCLMQYIENRWPLSIKESAFFYVCLTVGTLKFKL